MLKIIKFPGIAWNFLFNRLVLKYKKAKYGNDLKIRGKLLLRGKGQLIIGEHVVINSHYSEVPIGGDRTIFLIQNGAQIIIGNNVGISHGKIAAYSRVEIEDDVLLGADCRIYDTDFHSISYGDRVLKGDCDIQTRPVKIKKGAFIGAGSYILKGVTVGEKSIVGAGSVVTRDIPDGEIWAGNPAKKIRDIQ